MTAGRQPSANTSHLPANRHYSGNAESSKETMTSQPNTGSDPAAQDMSPEEIQAVIDRILAKDVPARNVSTPRGEGSGNGKAVLGKAQAISRLDEEHSTYDGDQQDLEERRAVRRVGAGKRFQASGEAYQIVRSVQSPGPRRMPLQTMIASWGWPRVSKYSGTDAVAATSTRWLTR